jgi:DNA polymerase III gamma/tau subunit
MLRMHKNLKDLVTEDLAVVVETAAQMEIAAVPIMAEIVLEAETLAAMVVQEALALEMAILVAVNLACQLVKLLLLNLVQPISLEMVVMEPR